MLTLFITVCAPSARPGSSQWGLSVIAVDVFLSLPGMLNAAIRDCPIVGGKIRSFDAAAVMGLPGVKKVVPVGDTAVAVVADTWWRAKTALDALPIDHEGDRDRSGAIGQTNPILRVMENRERKAHLLLERACHHCTLGVRRHGQNLELSSRQRTIELLHGRHLDPARSTPRRPKIQQHNFSPELRETNDIPGEISQHEIRRLITDLDDSSSDNRRFH